MSKIADFTDAEYPPAGRKAVLLFWAPWHEDSDEGGSWDVVLRTLAETTADSSIVFGRVHAEDNAHACRKYGVSAVPTFALLKSDGTVFERVEGGEDVSKVTQAVQRLINAKDDDKQDAAGNAAASSSQQGPSPEERLSKRLDNLIRSSEVMLFMKGTPDAPKCGFSRQAVELLQGENIPFASFNIVSDETVRQGLKKVRFSGVFKSSNCLKAKASLCLDMH